MQAKWRLAAEAQHDLLDLLRGLLKYCAADPIGSDWPDLHQRWDDRIAGFAESAADPHLALLTAEGTARAALAHLHQHADVLADAPDVVSAAAYARAVDHCWSSLLARE